MEHRNVLRILVALGSLALVAAARWSLAEQEWREILVARLHRIGATGVDAFPGVVQSDDVMLLGLVLLGCMLLALALPAPEPTPAEGIAGAAAGPSGSRAALGAGVVAVLLAAAAVPLLREDEPGIVAAVLWLLAVALSGAAAWMLDRARGVRLGMPLGQRCDRSAVLLLFLGTLVVAGHDVGHWGWAGTPDEGNFFPFARDIARGRSHHPLLSEIGMYGVHPVLSSAYQAVFMRLFGMDVFGWRLSSAFALAVAVPFVYLLGRDLRGRRFGLWAALFCACTPLALAFAHYGYNNAQILPFATAPPALFCWARRRGSAVAAWLAGAVSGLAFFTFYPARLALPLVVLLALCLGERPWTRALRGRWAPLLLAAGVAALPLLVHPAETAGRMFGQTSFRLSPEERPPAWPARIAAALEGKLPRVARHAAVSVTHPLWHPRPSHLLRHEVIDPLQGVLCLAGLILACRGARRSPACRFLALAYALSAVAVGSLSQHDCPPLTRLVFLGPFVGLLAALALEQVAVLVGRVAGRRAAATVGWTLVAASVLWGLGILRHGIYVRQHGYGEGTTSELVRVLEALPPGWRALYVQRWPTYMQSVDNFAAAYVPEVTMVYLRHSAEIASHLPRTESTRVVVAHDLPEGAERDDVEGILAARFPAHLWQETAPGERWNLRVLSIGDGFDPARQLPRPSPRPPWWRVLLGHLER